MANAQRTWVSAERSASFIVLVGLGATIGGLVIRDSAGVSTVLAGLGIGLLVAGTTYALTDGAPLHRLAITFVALVAVQLIAFPGVRWLGLVGLAGVLAGILYGRRP